MSVRYDINALTELLADFHTLTKMRIVVFDNNFNKIIAYPEENSDFCQMIKSNSKAFSLCKKCDENGCKKCINENNLNIYICHAGLTEAVAPIKINGIIIGYIMFGQVMDTKNKAEKRKSILDYCSEFCEDRAILEKNYDALEIKSDEQIKAAAKIMEVCACYLCTDTLTDISEDKLIFSICEYIKNNLSEKLDGDNLCKVFNLSRSTLFNISKKHFGMGISQYIRQERINAAAKYLRETNSSIIETAEKFGFSDYNYFSKVFKKQKGVSPVGYKNMYLTR